MSNVKITQLPIAPAIDGSEYIEIAQNTGAPTGYISRKAKTSLLMAGVATSFAARSATINVKDYGALGDNATDDTASIQAAIFAAFGTVAAPNGIGASSNKQLYFPPGNYKTTSVLIIPPVIGAVIYGAGRFTTTITNNTSPGIFTTNGFNYSRMSDMQLQTSNPSSIIFDLNHDGLNHAGVSSSFFCEFRNMFFSGGSIGMQVGAGGFTCSDNVYINCLFQAHTTAGLKFGNFNSLDHVIINCGFSGCGIGIWVLTGGVATVISSGFAQNTSWDIKIDNSGGGGTVLSGIRTESQNFVSTGNDAPVVMQGCGQSNGTAGAFVSNGGGDLTISSCISGNGKITHQAGSLAVHGFKTGRNDWISLFASPNLVNISGIRIPAGNLFDSNTTFAMLPSPTGFQSTRGFIKDSTVTAFGTAITVGGGVNLVPIWSNGTNWLVG